MPYGMHDGVMGWDGWMAMTLGALLWAALIALVVFGFVRWYQGGPEAFRSAMPSEDEALNILRQRYARGEISRQEFEEMRRELEGTL